MSSKIYDLFAEDLKEGKIYSLSNFHVRIYGGEETSRAVRFEKHIYFSNHTKLVPEEDNITNIPPFAVDLFPLHEVPHFLSDNRYLIGKCSSFISFIHVL